MYKTKPVNELASRRSTVTVITLHNLLTALVASICAISMADLGMASFLDDIALNTFGMYPREGT